MEIHFTEQAINKLLNQLKSRSYYLCLIYEVGGCGSPLDGVIRLQLIMTIPSNYVKISTNWIPVYTESSTLMFLEDILTIDFQSSGYLVKSNNQIYGSGYSLSIDK
ncbi:iron-sulfur cluster biosynthesis family protein [Halalkalibacter urbisdiaboli]|uniref:iron-sulfur cluster biosynthesis family protein n=1 Tax=Halalkalibacter urbisdiaboli TaxID=1960589 RepID=UPI0013FD6949|nr:iron-sulfur cluster biosynthesis family protein [Halalkalibacter urbisdiaboli]